MLKSQVATKSLLLLILMYSVTMIMGCGYTNPYTTNNKLSNNDTKRVELYLDMWTNKTNLLGYQATVQHDLILWLKKSNRFHITQDLNQADYILSGTIQTLDQPALIYGAFDRATVLRAELEFQYKLIDNKTTKKVFQQKNLIKRENYNVGIDAVRTNANRQKAIEIISKELANDIYIQLFYLSTLSGSQENNISIPTDTIETSN